MNTISTTRAVERCERLAKLGSAPAWWRVFALRRWLRAYRAIMALDISVHAEMLRSLYTPDEVKRAAARPTPLLAIPAIARKEGLGGPRRWVEPFQMSREPPREVRIVARDLARGTVEYEEP